MPDLLRVTDIAFTPASGAEIAGGLLGWLSFTVGGLRLDSVQLRRSRNNRLGLSFPGRRSRVGVLHRFVTPLSDEAHAEIERQVLAELRRQGGAL